MYSVRRLMTEIQLGAGLPPTFWQSEKGALAAAAMHSDPDHSSSPGKDPRALKHPGQRVGYLSGRAMPGFLEESLDAIIFAKVPGPGPAQKLAGVA